METLNKEVLELWTLAQEQFESLKKDFEKGIEKKQVAPLRRFRKTSKALVRSLKELRAQTLEIGKYK